MKKFDKEEVKEIPNIAVDCQKDEILVGDIVIGAYGTNSGYIFKGKVTKILRELIEVEELWTTYMSTVRVAPKRVRNMKYE